MEGGSKGRRGGRHALLKLTSASRALDKCRLAASHQFLDGIAERYLIMGGSWCLPSKTYLLHSV